MNMKFISVDNLSKKGLMSGIFFIVAVMLSGCYDTGYLDNPVYMTSQQKAAMDSTYHKLTGRWKYVGSYNYYLTFDKDTMVTVEQTKSYSDYFSKKARYKLGYDWKFTTAKSGKRALTGHIYFPTKTDFIEPFICQIEGDSTMWLRTDYTESTYNVEDPTMYFKKQ